MPELIEWPCDIPGCKNTSLDWDAICEMCYEVHCREHDNSTYHPCRTLKTKEAQLKKKAEAKHRYLSGLLEQLHLHSPTITQQGSSLRANRPCTLIIPDNPDQLLQSGWLAGFNVHFALDFDDGIRWLLRVRQDRYHRLPEEIREGNIDSEVTTLNVLKDGGIPVPRAFLPPPSSQNGNDGQAIPFDYFFYEFLNGKTWHVPKHPILPVDLPDDQLSRLLEGYAQTRIQLSNLHLPVRHIGCLRSSSQSDQIVVGPIIARGCFQNPNPPYLLGPFSTMKDRYLAHIEAAFHYISLGAICDQAPVDAYLWHLELQELVMHSRVLAEPLEEVFIKHDDEKADHLMWDEKEKVVGMLDWEWAYVTSKGEAFSSPYIFWESGKFIGGDNSLTKEENLLIGIYEREGRTDLADCVRNGRLYQRLSRIGQYEAVYRKKGFREPFGPDPAPRFNPPKYVVDWRIYMMKRYEGNDGLKEIMEKHDWSIERAEQEAKKFHEEKKKKELDKKES